MLTVKFSGFRLKPAKSHFVWVKSYTNPHGCWPHPPNMSENHNKPGHFRGSEPVRVSEPFTSAGNTQLQPTKSGKKRIPFQHYQNQPKMVSIPGFGLSTCLAKQLESYPTMSSKLGMQQHIERMGGSDYPETETLFVKPAYGWTITSGQRTKSPEPLATSKVASNANALQTRSS